VARHFEEPVVITGGIATAWHLLQNNQLKEKIHLNDIDIVVEDLSCLRDSLRRDFLIRHFHPFREKGKILIMLVDEEHRTRIDVFTPTTSSLTERLTNVTARDGPLRLVSTEDLLAKVLSIVTSVTQGKSVEPKHFEHFHSLYAIADLGMVQTIWREYRKENQSKDFVEAAEEVRRSVTSNPELLRASCYSQDLHQACSWCHESEMFPLAPRPKIYDLLGYV